MKIYYYLYKITNKINNKIYIGVHQTTNLQDNYMGSGKLIKGAIKKYGINNFKKEIIEFFENEIDMFDKECEIVNDVFVVNENTYNLKVGGRGNSLGSKNTFFGKKHSEESKCKMSLSKIGQIPSEETRRKMSLSGKGRKHTEETKEILRIKNSGENNPSYGRKMTEKQRLDMIKRVTGLKRTELTKEKIRKARMGTSHSELTKNKISKSQTGKKHSDETKKKISLILSNRICKEETKRKLSEAHKGKKFTDEHRENIGKSSKITNVDRKKIFNPLTNDVKSVKSKNVQSYIDRGWILGTNKSSHNKGIKEEKVTCPYCGKNGGKNAMMRWHFDNCKLK